MEIGAKIKKLRTSKMMTQSELAGHQITRNMLSQIENGSALPSLSTILYIAERLNVPAGFLLAEGDDEFIYRKMNAMGNIKRAYRVGDYRICRDICLSVLDEEDDEIQLILAECAFALAREAFQNGHLHESCRLFDEAIEYADKTIYRADHIRIVAFGYFTYMHDISLTLYSEHLNLNDCNQRRESFSCSDEFCRYVGAIQTEETHALEYVSQYPEKEQVLARHVEALLFIREGAYDTAIGRLQELLNGDTSIPEPVIYSIFENLEVCCRESGDYKGAYEYANNKVGMLDRLLTESDAL
jgi:transcriptional regulator with XRE-family HTH domain